MVVVKWSTDEKDIVALSPLVVLLHDKSLTYAAYLPKKENIRLYGDYAPDEFRDGCWVELRISDTYYVEVGEMLRKPPLKWSVIDTKGEYIEPEGKTVWNSMADAFPRPDNSFLSYTRIALYNYTSAPSVVRFILKYVEIYESDEQGEFEYLVPLFEYDEYLMTDWDVDIDVPVVWADIPPLDIPVPI